MAEKPPGSLPGAPAEGCWASNPDTFEGGPAPEGVGHPLGDRARLAGPDLAAVQPDDRDDLGARPGQEALVGAPDVVAGELRLAGLQPELAGDVDHGAAGDPLEGPMAGRRGQDLALPDDEDVVGGALGHVALVVEHD